jgi:hypothetical protein
VGAVVLAVRDDGGGRGGRDGRGRRELGERERPAVLAAGATAGGGATTAVLAADATAGGSTAGGGERDDGRC